jgi:membrane protein
MIETSAPGLGRQDDQFAAVDRRAVTASADTGVSGVRRRVAVARERLERLLLWRVWERMLEIEFVDRSVALAGKAFVSFFPLVIVVAAFVPERVRSSIITTVSARLGIRGDALAAVREAFASSDDLRKATGVMGLVFTIFFATSFTTALQRAYLRVWRRPPGARTGAYWRGATWLLAMLGTMAVLGFARGALDGAIGVGLFAILSLSATSALWWFTAWFLLLGDVRPRVLLPTAVITSVALAGFALSATVWMPGVVTDNEAQFGFFGIALSLITWFSGAAICVLVGACAGPVFAEDAGRVGMLIRGPGASTLNARARPSLPPPVRELSLRDAFHGSDQS